MSSIYLVRHGQAGLRQNYDALSELGRTQARMLADYLVKQKINFQAIYSGALERQRQTAREAWKVFREAGANAPDIMEDLCWNEFDLSKVYEDLAPQLSEADPQFKQEYAEMMRLVDDENAAIHRRWSPCDVKVVRAWIEGRHACTGESWSVFRQRVLTALESLSRYESGQTVAVFTSATPIAVWTGMALGIAENKIMRLAGVMYNSAFSTLRMRQEDVTLFSFNNVPHLAEAGLRTFR